MLAILSGKDTFAFHATGSVVSRVNERSATRRQSLLWRLCSLDMISRATYLLVVTFLILVRVTEYLGNGAGAHYTTALLGPQLCLVLCVYSVALPLHYMIFPPSVPEVKDLLEKDTQGVSRPRKGAIRGLRIKNGFLGHCL